MKKTISMLVLVAMCVIALASCGGGSAVNVDTFQNAVNNTNPTKVVINTTTTDALGELKGSFTANFAEDGSSTIAYSYEKWLPIGEGEADELKKTYSGTVACDANGNYSGDDLDGVIGDISNAVAINLKAITSVVTISEDETTLTATVAAAETEAVFGAAYAYDVTLTVVKGESAVESITITFTNGGTSAEIFARYE